MPESEPLLSGDEVDWWSSIKQSIAENLAESGPRLHSPPVHMIEDWTWPIGALGLCERGEHGGRPAPHRWHFYTDRGDLVTCRSCIEWMHA